MSNWDERKLVSALEGLRSVREDIGAVHAGAALFDATIAALKSHLCQTRLLTA